MKLGIFGDSFATLTTETTKNSEYAWFNILSNKLNYEVCTHGLSGTSIYQSYKKFLEHYKSYDKIIFVLSDVSRYTKFSNFERYEEPLAITSISRLENLRNHGTKLTLNDQRFLNHLEGYFIVDDIEFKVDMARLMMHHMLELNKNTYFYAGFDGIIDDEIPRQYTLHNIIDLQLKYFKIKTSDFLKFKETPNMIAHMTHEYNEAFANVIHSKITTGKFDFSYFDQVKKIEQPSEYYLKRI
jgi:hypothetical protein